MQGFELKDFLAPEGKFVMEIVYLSEITSCD